MKIRKINTTGWWGLVGKLNEVIDAVNALLNPRIVRGGETSGDYAEVSKGSIVYKLRTFKPGGSSIATPPAYHPFEIIKVGAALYVKKGWVAGLVPTLGGTPLSDDYLDNELSLPGSGSQTYYLKAISTGDLDDEGVTSVTIETSDPGTDTASQAKQPLGSVTMDGSDIDSFSSALTGSQNVDSCGDDHSWNRV